MAIKIAPKTPDLPKMKREAEARVVAAVERYAARKNVRKPSGKAKEAVTLRLSKECCNYFQRQFGEDWRAEMQRVLERIAQ